MDNGDDGAIEEIGVGAGFERPGDGRDAADIVGDSGKDSGVGKFGTVDAGLRRGVGEFNRDGKADGCGEMVGTFEGRVDLGRDEGADAGVGCGAGKEDMVDAVRALVRMEREPGVVWALVDVGVCLRDEQVGIAKMVVDDVRGGGVGRSLERA